MTRVDTESLIRALVDAATPVRPLPRPWLRGAIWLVIAIPYIVVVVYIMSPRADLAAKMMETRFLFEQLAALATGIAAAVAAFSSTIPGYSPRALLLPVLPLAAWLGALGQGCVNAWMEVGPDGLTLQPDWLCLPAVAVVGIGPAVAMVAMLRRGAPLMPGVTVALGGLAAAGLGDFGLRLSHAQDASLMLLVWQFGSACLLAAVAGCLGRYLLNWRSRMGTPARLTAAE